MGRSKVRSLFAFAFAVGAVLGSISPAAAYNEENVKHIRMQRLDDIGCDSPIRLNAALTDSAGNPVPGAEVRFSYKKSFAGDTIGPTTVFSDTAGNAETAIRLSCVLGARIIRASVPGDGSAQIVVTCNQRHGCNVSAHRLPETGPRAHRLPDTGSELIPRQEPTMSQDDAVGKYVPLLLLGASLAAVSLARWSRRPRRGA